MTTSDTDLYHRTLGALHRILANERVGQDWGVSEMVHRVGARVGGVNEALTMIDDFDTQWKESPEEPRADDFWDLLNNITHALESPCP